MHACLRTALASLLCLTVAGTHAEPEISAKAGFDIAELDELVRPQDDFYQYVNGQWITNTEIPPEWSRYGTMQIVYERTEEQLRDIVENAETSSRIGALYRSFMDEERAESLGLTPLKAELKEINAIRSRIDVMSYFGRALQVGIEVPVNFYIDADAQNPEQPLMYWWQDGLGLPDRDYYLANSPELVEIREEYLKHIEKMHDLADWQQSKDAAKSILRIETRLAEIQWSRVQNRNRQRIYSNQYSMAQAAELSPGFDWARLMNAGGFEAPDLFVIAQTDYFTALGQLVDSVSVEDWQTYLRFRLLEAYAPYLNKAVVTENYNFRRGVLRGQKEMRPRWKRGIQLVNSALGEEVGQIYVERHFPPASKQRVDTMIENLRAAFGQSIESLDWMSDDTKAAALEKLSSFTAKIGYPDKWKDYSTLDMQPEDLVGNVRRANAFEHREAVNKLKRPIDRTEWGMTPQTVNAYYRATLNEIVFPAAILQPPFFDFEADDAMNYGAIGAVIGHEFSHGFDDQGRKFSGDGRLSDWWTDEDALQYEARSEKLVNQYNGFEPLEGLNLNGQLSLGENIADLAGLIMSYRAWKILTKNNPAPVIDGFTGEQRFFIGYAITWRTKMRDEYLREMVLSDPHSPPRYRVLGPLKNMPEFYAAFGVKKGDQMYLPEAKRAKIW
ncbi:MAG: M13 family metallopeptidase [Gammaproteobacteria bacterium]|nr:M13 family metallopeptidase [Gammaproteobacteria bacterium]